MNARSTSNITQPPDVPAAARDYLARGWSPVPVPHRDKNPGFRGWHKLRLTEATIPQHFNGGLQNVGVLLGAPSNGLVDVDLDWREAVELASYFLPATAARFGRPGKMGSHWLYVVPGLKTERLGLSDKKEDEEHDSVAELRSTGAQTVFPPSTHKETGEPIAWGSDGEPGCPSAAELRVAVKHLAVAALVLRHYPRHRGQRDEIAMALGGALLRAGYTEAEAEHTILAVATAASDEETRARADTVGDTARKLRAGEPVTGLPKLVELLGCDDKAERFLKKHLRATTTGASSSSAPDVEGGEGFHLTDLGNAQRLVARHGANIRYATGLGWLVWAGARWKRDETGAVMRYAKATVHALFREALALTDPDHRAKLLAHALRSESASRLAAMITLAETEAGVAVEAADFDADPWFFNVENGTLDLRTGTLRPHRRDDLITKLAPVPFDPRARWRAWLAFLRDVTKRHKRLRRYLQHAVGYSLTGLIAEKVLFLNWGEGDNGKTAFLTTLTRVCGDYAVDTPIGTLTARRDPSAASDDIARLRGARLVTAIESAEGQTLNEPAVKLLTGGDRRTARHFYQGLFTYEPSDTWWIATNYRPVITGTDQGIWGRLRLMPWRQLFSNKQADRDAGALPAKPLAALRAELWAERAGILNWALAGCLAWQREGLGTSPEVEKATAHYRAEQDTVEGFLLARCALERGAHVLVADLTPAYFEWCHEEDRDALSGRDFAKRLDGRGLKRGKVTGGGRCRRGIRLLPKGGGNPSRAGDSRGGDEGRGARGARGARESLSSPTGGSREEITIPAPLTPLTPLPELPGTRFAPFDGPVLPRTNITFEQLAADGAATEIRFRPEDLEPEGAGPGVPGGGQVELR